MRISDWSSDVCSSDLVERWRAGEIARGLSLETINRDIASIKAVFNRAVDWELIAANPLAKLKKSRTDDCRKVRFLGDDEETRLRAALDAREERRCAEIGRASGRERVGQYV